MSSQTDSHLLNFSRVEVVPKETEVNGVSTIADKQRCIIGNAQWRMVSVGAESRSLNNFSDRLEK